MPMLLPIVMSLDLMLAAGAPAAPEAPCQADLVAINGHVYTVNASQPWAEAIAVCGERIARVGTTAEVLAIAGPNARRIVLEGPTVIPDINDSHVHLVDGGTELTEVDLRDAKSGRGGRVDRGVCQEAAERPLDPVEGDLRRAAARNPRHPSGDDGGWREGRVRGKVAT
jgi:hypothetical protein